MNETLRNYWRSVFAEPGVEPLADDANYRRNLELLARLNGTDDALESRGFGDCHDCHRPRHLVAYRALEVCGRCWHSRTAAAPR
jgi:hypothetical protein